MKLANIINEFISGDWGNEEFSDETPNEVYCIRGADIVPITRHDFSNIPKRYVSDKALENKTLKAGDMVVEKSGGSPTQSTGRVVYISDDLMVDKENVVCSNFCTAFRVNDGWNPYFVYQYWQYIYNANVFFNFEGKTSGIKNLQLDAALSSIQIQEWQLSDQNRIADILMNLESKMHINIEINQNLEAMANQLYDYWFVQFDFPNEEGKPYKSSGGKMVWNEKLKREIPEGWYFDKLSEIVDIKNGATPSTADEVNYGGNVVWITPKDLSDQNSKFTYYGQRNITQKGFDSCSTSLLPIGTILLSSRAPIGLLSIAKTKLCTNQGFKSLIPKEPIYTNYLYYYIKRHIPQIEQLGTGTTFKEVSKEDLATFPVLCISNRKLFEHWNTISECIFSRQYEISKEIIELTKQRDELLPLLMNGQVSVNSDLS
jgi:type I restriction enzyme S subunit